MDKWIVLDRDGVINADSDDYIKSAQEWQALPGSIESISKLYQAGYHVAIATNQSGLARGLFDLSELEQMHQKCLSLVEAAGGHIDGIFYCPHGPEDGCPCRKPKPGMLDAIEVEFGISLNDAYFVGDSEKDLAAAQAKGCRPVLVKTGKGLSTMAGIADKPQYEGVAIFDDLAAFVDDLLRKDG